MQKSYFVYILTNKSNRVLYVGITNNLSRRIGEHRSGLGSTFTRQYRAHKLVYFERFEKPLAAIAREKQIKAGSRRKKVLLIESINPEWQDLTPEIG